MPPWCPRRAGRLATSWHPPGAHKGPSSSRRWRAPAPAAPPSGPRLRPATATPLCGADRERAHPALRLPPWRPASRPTASSSTPAAARRLAQRTARPAAPSPRLHRSMIGTSSATSGTVRARWFFSVSTYSAPPPPLASTARLSRRPGPGTDTRSPAWRPASSPQRSPASARTGTTSRYGPAQAAVSACSSARVSACPSRLTRPLAGRRTVAATLCWTRPSATANARMSAAWPGPASRSPGPGHGQPGRQPRPTPQRP